MSFLLRFQGIVKGTKNLIFRLIRSLIFGIVLVWKHFNFLARSRTILIDIMYVEVTFIKITNIFLARLVGHIFVEDAIKFFGVINL